MEGGEGGRGGGREGEKKIEWREGERQMCKSLQYGLNCDERTFSFCTSSRSL